MRQRSRIDLVVFESRGGDRLALQRVRHVPVQTEVVAEFREPPPAVGGFEDRRRARLEHAKDRIQLGY